MRQLQIPIFDIDVDDEGLGLFGLSFVDNPAIQVEMHCFKNEPVKVYLSSHEKREVVSPVIIPDQLIYREANGIPYYMKAKADTIRKMYEKYMLSGNWNNFTYQHENIDAPMEERALDGIYLQRLWIIEDEKNDDAFTKYGFDNLPKGTMMMKCKVNNRQIWNEIREGNLRGISLEAFFNKINSNKALQITYKKMEKTLNLFQKFVAFLNEVSQEAEDLKDEALKDETNSGEIELKYYLDDEHYFEVDGDGFVKDENGENISEGEYKLADGNVFVVGGDGKFVETRALTEQAGDEEVEAPIAEGFKEEDKVEEEEEKEDETKDNTNDGEADNEAEPAEGETADETDEAADKDSDKEDGETAGEDEPVEKDEDDDEKKPTVNAFPFEIDGVEYLLPEEVINYIQSLQTSKVEVEEKLTNLSNQTPSAQPVGAVVKNGTPSKDDVINDRFEALERFKQWRKQRG